MKSAETLAQTVFSIAMIVLVGLVIFIFGSTAVARTPSVEVVEAGVLDIDAVARTPSLQLAQPLEGEIVRRTPSLDMGFFPIDMDPNRKSLIWNAFPQPLQDEIFEKTPSQAVREPLNIECCGPTMHFNMKEAATTEITIYSVDGRLVRRLTEALPDGESSVTWDGTDDRGARAASGVYFARVQANAETGKGKLLLIH